MTGPMQTASFAEAIDALDVLNDVLSDVRGDRLRVRRLVHETFDAEPTPEVVGSDHTLVLGLKSCRGVERREGGRITGKVDQDRTGTLLPAYRPARWRLPQPAEVLHVHVPDATFRDLLAREDVDPDRVELIDRMDVADPFLAALAPALMLETDPDCRHTRLVVDGFDTVIAGHLLRAYSNHGRRLDRSPARRRRRARDPRAVAAAQAEMLDRIDETIPLKQIAENVGLSPFALLRRFRAETGLTPYLWLRRERLLRALDLLRTTDLPVAEVAFAVGFASQSHMTTLMRRDHGITPGMVRKEVERVAGVGPARSAGLRTR